MYHYFTFCRKNDNEKVLNAYLSVRIKLKDNCIYSVNGGGGFSIYLSDSYVCLEMDMESKRIAGISGELSMRQVKKRRIKLPNNIQKGVLTVVDLEEYPAGCGTRMRFNDCVYFDKTNSILQLGDVSEEYKFVRFLNNAYAQLDESNHLLGILITDVNKQ